MRTGGLAPAPHNEFRQGGTTMFVTVLPPEPDLDVGQAFPEVDSRSFTVFVRVEGHAHLGAGTVGHINIQSCKSGREGRDPPKCCMGGSCSSVDPKRLW